MTQTFLLIECRDKETDKFLGWHDGTWPTASLHSAKMYTSRANVDRALRYHKWMDSKYNIRVVHASVEVHP